MEGRNNEPVKLLIHGAAEGRYAKTPQQEKWESHLDRAMKLAKWTAIIFSAAMVIAVGTESILAAAVILVLLLLMGFGFYAMSYDAKNSYLVIEKDKLHVVTYPCRIRRERVFSFAQVAGAEIIKVRGILPYIVLRDKRKKHLFDIAANEDSLAIFGKYLNAEQ